MESAKWANGNENEMGASCLIAHIPTAPPHPFTFSETSQIEFIWLVKSRQTFVRIKIAKQIKQSRIFTRAIFTLLKAIPIVPLPSYWPREREGEVEGAQRGYRLKAYNKLSNLN